MESFPPWKISLPNGQSPTISCADYAQLLRTLCLDEVRYIQQRAAVHDGRLVTLGQLILFSTETGDAWLLDTEDRLATRIAQDGVPLPIHIEDTDTSFSVEWKR